MRYVQKDLTVTPYEIPGVSWPVTTELFAKLNRFGAFAKLIFDEDKLVDIEDDTEAREAYIAANTPTEEDLIKRKVDRLRQDRAVLLKAFDVYKTNLVYGVISETDEEHEEIVAWYQQVLSITDLASVDSKIEWPQIPAGIAKYMPTGITLSAV